MSKRKIAGVNAIVFFLFWLLVLLAGADFPPPPGFLWLVATVALCAIVVYWRIPTYINWSQTRRHGRYWRVPLDGIIAGLLVALPFVVLGSGEPSMTRQPFDYAIWFFVLATIGMLNSLGLYTINTLIANVVVARRTGKISSTMRNTLQSEKRRHHTDIES